MTPYILAALMAATVMNDTAVRDGGQFLCDQECQKSIEQKMIDVDGCYECDITGCRSVPCEEIFPTVPNEPDTIGYWLDRKRFCSPDPRTMGNPNISYGDNYCHDPYEVVDTVYVMRRPGAGGK